MTKKPVFMNLYGAAVVRDVPFSRDNVAQILRNARAQVRAGVAPCSWPRRLFTGSIEVQYAGNAQGNLLIVFRGRRVT